MLYLSDDVWMLKDCIPIRFESYPDVVFLLRKIGSDYNDD